MSTIRFSSEHKVTDDGAKVELTTVEHEGRSFTNLGAVADHKQGFIVAYVGSGQLSGYAHDVRPLTTFDGKQIGVCWPKSSWNIQNSAYGTRMFAFGARIDGAEYHGRTFGEGMCVVLCRNAKQHSRATHGK